MTKTAALNDPRIGKAGFSPEEATAVRAAVTSTQLIEALKKTAHFANESNEISRLVALFNAP